MNTLDLVLLGIVALFSLWGFGMGLINTVGSIVGLFFGAYFAGRVFDPFGTWLAKFITNPGLAKVIAFIIIFILASQLIGLVFKIVDKIFRFIAIIPFLKTFNRLLGAILGALEGVLAAGAALYVIVRFPISESLTAQLQASKLAPLIIDLAKLVTGFLPEIVKNIKALV